MHNCSTYATITIAPNKKKFDKIKKLKEEIASMPQSRASKWSRKASRGDRSESPKKRNSEAENEVILVTEEDHENEVEKDNDDQSEISLTKTHKEDDVKHSLNVDQPRATSFFSGKVGEKRNTLTTELSGPDDPWEKLRLLEMEPDDIIIVKLSDGDSFGELALINNAPRAATIICDAECYFAIMDRTDYNKTLNKIEVRNINKIIDFFKNLPYFSSYGRSALDKIRLQFGRAKFIRKQYVYKEGDESDYVYIVINGDFELVKQVKHVEKKEMNYKKYIHSNLINKPSVDSNRSEVDAKIAQFTRVKVLTNSSECNNHYRIALLAHGQMFGDQDAFHERPYQTSVVCRSNDGLLYQITRENFQKLKNHGD